MASAPSLGVPELGGIATYMEASRVGFSVEENVRRLLRFQWVERRLAQIVTARLAATPEWEVKGGFALHQYQDVEHATNIADRIRELRNPAPRLDESPDETLEAFLRELESAEDTLELIAGVYRVARADLAMAYREHIDHCNPLIDFPTRRALRMASLEEEEALGWGARSVGALMGRSFENEARVRRWEDHLRGFLGATRGVSGDLPANEGFAPPIPRPAHMGDFRPRRDRRFSGQHNFSFPPHTVYDKPHIPAVERNLALLCKRLLEMDVPEMMSSFLSEETEQPWEFVRDYSRQLWDEARHSMMGESAFEVRGVNWTQIPLNVGFSLRLNLHALPEERRLLLLGIEQSLMPGDTGKKAEQATAADAGDLLSAHIHDYDWADEVMHTQIGRRWVQVNGRRELAAGAQAVHEKTWEALEQYKSLEPQDAEWWYAFVRRVLGMESAALPDDVNPETVVIVQSG